MVKMDRITKENKFVHKNISISEEQSNFIDENFISLSKFIQKKLEELMQIKK